MSKPKLPVLRSDEEAEEFVDRFNLNDFDLSGARPYRFEFSAEPYGFEVVRDGEGAYRAQFTHAGEVVFATESYSSRAGAVEAIEMIKQKGPTAAVVHLDPFVPDRGMKLR